MGEDKNSHITNLQSTRSCLQTLARDGGLVFILSDVNWKGVELNFPSNAWTQLLFLFYTDVATGESTSSTRSKFPTFRNTKEIRSWKF
jgi:hypothetical protein